MKITKVKLSLAEKQALKKKYSLRMIIGILFIGPVLSGCLFMGISSLISLSTGIYDAMDLFGISLLAASTYLFFRFGLPFYRQTFSTIRAVYKIVIETYVIEIRKEFAPGVVLSYTVITEADRPLRSFRTSMLNDKFGYKDMKVGSTIAIHCLEDNDTDILYIESIVN